MYWDWQGEDPVEIVLVAFILVLFFTLPRPSCGVQGSGVSAPPQPPVQGESPE